MKRILDAIRVFKAGDEYKTNPTDWKHKKENMESSEPWVTTSDKFVADCYKSPLIYLAKGASQPTRVASVCDCVCECVCDCDCDCVCDCNCECNCECGFA